MQGRRLLHRTAHTPARARIALGIAATLAGGTMMLAPHAARAQDDAGPPPLADTSSAVAKANRYDNLYQGQFTPGSGFDIIRTTKGTLNISFYGLFRYLNQMPGDQSFTDHLGRVQTVKARNDLNWHRTMVWVTGWFSDPRFRYNITLWSLPTTQQTLLFGNLRYLLNEALNFGVGIGPNLTNRSMQGSWPYWAASDRQMGEEFIRGGFSSSFWLTGRFPRGIYYTTSINTNISQLGVPAASDTRDMAYSGSIWWQPTTGEFGPRNGFGDLEHHQRLATQLGMSACTSRESRYAPDTNSPLATQIRLSDGLNPFDTGALADTVTVNKLTYQIISLDAGAKYRGLSLQSEYSYRVLSEFDATGPLPLNRIKDQMMFAEAMKMVGPRLGIYAAGSYAWDDFQRHPFELGGGASFYPYGSRQVRLNLHVMHVDRSPASSNFGYYSAGLTGTIFSLGADILL
jgi:hypothetical protein